MPTRFKATQHFFANNVKSEHSYTEWRLDRLTKTTSFSLSLALGRVNITLIFFTTLDFSYFKSEELGIESIESGSGNKYSKIKTWYYVKPIFRK